MKYEEHTKILKGFAKNPFFHIFLIFCVLLPFQFALNPTPGIDLAIVRVLIPLMFLLWMFSGIKNKLLFLRKEPAAWLVAAFLLLAIFSLLFSANLSWSVRKLLFLLTIFPIYFISVTLLENIEKKRKAIAALVVGGAVAAFIGILQFSAQFVFGIDPVYSFLAKNIAPFFLGDSFSKTVLAYPSWLVNSGGTTLMRAIGTFPDPHMFSYYLGMLAPWSIILWATTGSHKKMFLISSALLLTADIFTFSRGGYVALIAAALTVLPLVSKDAAKKIIAAMALLVLLTIVVPHNPVSGRFVSSFNIQEGSNRGRIDNWKQALIIIARHPLGVGIGSYSLAVDPKASYRDPIYAHNLYLDIAAELGIASAGLFIGILCFTFKKFWHAAKEEPLFIAGVASITLFAVHSLVENSMYSVHVLPLLMIIIAISTLPKKYEKITIPK